MKETSPAKMIDEAVTLATDPGESPSSSRAGRAVPANSEEEGGNDEGWEISRDDAVAEEVPSVKIEDCIVVLGGSGAGDADESSGSDQGDDTDDTSASEDNSERRRTLADRAPGPQSLQDRDVADLPKGQDVGVGSFKAQTPSPGKRRRSMNGPKVGYREEEDDDSDAESVTCPQTASPSKRKRYSRKVKTRTQQRRRVLRSGCQLSRYGMDPKN